MPQVQLLISYFLLIKSCFILQIYFIQDGILIRITKIIFFNVYAQQFATNYRYGTK